MILVQRIKIEWTKKSRGMPGAAARNAVPQALPLLETGLDKITVHEVRAAEENDFFLEQKTFGINSSQSYWALLFTQEDNRLAVTLDYQTGHFGDPTPRQFPRQIFSLKTGETASFHINGRHGFRGRHYTQYYVNIAYGEPDRNVFIQRRPDHFLDRTANLL